jgi:spermidine synthase
MHLIVLLLLFFCSGVAALCYEVVWIRLLSLTLSITVYALTTVLCAFMGGMGLGAALAARLADRLQRPLLVFGLAELGIAVAGLTVPSVLFGWGTAYIWLQDTFGTQGVAFVVGRFALAFAVLMVPATLMGTTLPFLSRIAIGDEGEVGRGAGALYAANTLGAVGGAVLAGFVLIPTLGLTATSRTAAAINVVIGVVAIVLGWNRKVAAAPRDATSRAEQPPMSRAARLAVIAFCVSGFTAMGYELLWTRSLEHFTHNSTYAYSAMLATFLSGIGLGSALMARAADRMERPLLGLAVVQLVVGITVIISLRIFMTFETLVPDMARAIGGIDSWGKVVALIFSEAGLTMFATTLCFGATFPLVARIVVDSISSVGNRIGTAYVANTIGSILGSFGVGFLVLPWLGIRGTFVALIVLNLSLAALLGLNSGDRLRGRWVAAIGVVSIAAAFLLIPPNLLEAQFRSRFGELRFYREEITDTIMVTESADGERMIRYGDGRGTAGTWTAFEDRMYAHIPMMLHANPKRVLQIGFGVGNTLASVVRYPIEKATCIELSPGVADAAPFFRTTNHDVLEDPRVELVTNDGRNFLLATHELFDVIRSDPPELHTAGVVNLYTQEFYEMARAHLRPGGIFSIWVNTVFTPEEDLAKLANTFAAVFPHVSVWTGPAAYSWVFNGSMEPHDPDVTRLVERFGIDAVREDLVTVGIDNPFYFTAHFVFGRDGLKAFAGDAPLVTDDHTQLDFSTPKSADSFFGIANVNTDHWLVQLIAPGAQYNVADATFMRKIQQLAKYKRPVFPFLRNVEAAGFDPAQVEAYLAAPQQAPVPTRSAAN